MLQLDDRVLRIWVHRHRAAQGEILDEALGKSMVASPGCRKCDIFELRQCQGDAATNLGIRWRLYELLLFFPGGSVLFVLLLKLLVEFG